MKMKKIKLVAAITTTAVVGGGFLTTIPLLTRSINPNTIDQTNNSNNITNTQSTEQTINTNGLLHTQQTQIVDDIDDIIVENFDIWRGNASSTEGSVSSAIVNKNGEQQIYVWGNNAAGQLGLGDAVQRAVPTLLPASRLGNYTSIKKFWMSIRSCYAIVEKDGVESIYVWGHNTQGQLGINSAINQFTPVLFETTYFANFKSFKALHFVSGGISGDNTSSYAIVQTTNNTEEIYTWGRNSFGQLGIGSTDNSHIPTLITKTNFPTNITKIKDLSISYHSYVIFETTTGDKLFIWGWNGWGQLGLGTPASQNETIPVAFNNPAVLPAGAIIKSFQNRVGYSSGMIVVVNGVEKLYAWGRNDYGQVGNNSITNQSLPFELQSSIFGGFTGVDDFCIDESSYVRFKDNTGKTKIFVWGKNDSGQLGIGTTINQKTPTILTSSLLGNYEQIYFSSFESSRCVASNNFAYVKSPSGDKLFIWGDNQYGQLGDGSFVSKNTPVLNTTFDLSTNRIAKFNGQSTFGNFFLTLEKNGAQHHYAVGRNTEGELGLNNFINTTVFTEVLPIVVTNPVAHEKSSPVTAADAYSAFNTTFGINKQELSKYVDTSTFPKEARLTINALTKVNSETGNIDLVLDSDSHFIPLKTSPVKEQKQYKIRIDGFKQVKDIPIISKSKPNLSDAQFYEKAIVNELTNRKFLEQYLDLSCIPSTATIEIEPVRVATNDRIEFVFKSDQVYKNNGKTSNEQYSQTIGFDLLVSGTNPIITVAIITGSSMLVLILFTILYLTSKKVRYSNR